ncbi:MAG: transglycosylase SLT domain-containing protein [Gammaproteobacteria bacterium]
MHRVFLLICLLFFQCVTSAGEPVHKLLKQRADYLAAEEAIRNNDLVRYHGLYEQLQTYPLLPYLRYQFIVKHLAQVPANEILAFTEEFHNTPLSRRLMHNWLHSLAKRQKWNTFVNDYRPVRSTKLQCQYHWALYKSGQKKNAYQNLEKLWLVGYSQPRECDRIFGIWQKDGMLTTELAWQRIQLAMKRNNVTLVRYLNRFVGIDEQRWAERWISVHRKPGLVLSKKLFSKPHPIRHRILIHGIKRIARSDPLKATDVWNTIKSEYPFSEKERSEIERYLAMSLALHGKSEALTWLAAIDTASSDKTLREWRVRSAIFHQDWAAALDWIDQLNPDEQQTERWLYWKARALISLGFLEMAKPILLELAKYRSYYGFLAADFLDQPYQITDQPLDIDIDIFNYVAQIPAIQRARELYYFNRIVEARREWYLAIQNMNPEQLRLAAKLAQSWGWHDRAIMTIIRTDYRDDLALRFPLAHREVITTIASQHNIDPALAYAVIRKESAFTADAHSNAGAVGLMQLLPRTAKYIARTRGLDYNGKFDLLDVNTNLNFGIRYLREKLSRFNGNPILATAAYNAGTRRVHQWLPVDKTIPADIWIETIPIAETRSYIQNILAYRVIYEKRMNQTLTRISDRMLPISSGTSTASIATQKVKTSGDPS